VFAKNLTDLLGKALVTGRQQQVAALSASSDPFPEAVSLVCASIESWYGSRFHSSDEST